MDVNAYLESLKPSVMTLGLERITELIGHLPQPPKMNNILVAGTNGKGSTAAFLASILDGVEQPVGLFTSPHLLSVHERIRLSGVPISDEDFRKVVEEVKHFASSLENSPTFFEFMTAAAAHYFRKVKTRFNVLEVGLGGRLDATNACSGPVSVITRISHDHTHILGRTLTAIAEEKAGIIKPGQKVVVAPQNPAVMKRLCEIAHERGAEIVKAQDIVDIQAVQMDVSGMNMEISLKGMDFPVHTVLPGRHQLENLATAIAASTLISTPTIDTLQLAIARTRWPGRLDLLTADGHKILVDGAHNPSGVRVLADFLNQVDLPRPLHLIFGSVTKKSPLQSLRSIMERTDHIHLVPIATTQRSWDISVMERLAENLSGSIPVTIERDLRSGLKASEGPGSTLITGSLYLVSEVFQCLDKSPWHLTTQVMN